MSNEDFEFESFEAITTNIKEEGKEFVDNDVDILKTVKNMEDCIENNNESQKIFIGSEEDVLDASAAYLVSSKYEPLETQVIVDPLQNQQEEVKSNFDYLYNNNDILKDDNISETMLPTRVKRARIVLKSQSGLQWSIDNNNSSPPKMLMSMLPKSKGPAKIVSHPLESWLLYFDEPVMKFILKYTNEAIKKCRGNAGYQNPTDISELRAWLGLKYLCGIFRNSHNNGPLEELWSLELGNAVFRSTMSFQRYMFLSQNLRLIDNNIEPNAKFKAIQHVFDKFLINCRSYYSPSNICAVLEHTVPVGDTLHSSLLYMCDTKCLYICNGLLNKSEKRTELNLLQLICDIKGTKRCVFYNELPLNVKVARDLHNSNVSTVFTLSEHSGDMPKHLEVGKTVYSQDLSLTINNEKRAILTCGLPECVCPSKLFKIVIKCKENFNHCLNTFSTTASAPHDLNQNNWELNFLNRLLDIACVNAWTILRLSDKCKENIDQRDFQRKLGLYLTQQQLQKRLKRTSNLSLIQKLNICELLGEPTELLLSKASEHVKNTCSIGKIPSESVTLPEDIILYSKLMGKRQRCRGCPSKNSNKTRFRCQQCQVPFCNKHLILRCAKCTGLHIL